MNTQKVDFIKSAANKKAFLRDGRHAVAFAGRSNVGKSSVINSLLNRKNYARVGATPGKTVQVNYFLVDGAYFIDLPGYGYARVSGDERRRWGALMEDFFQEPNLFTMGVLIVDSRHAPTADDVTMAEYFFDSGRPFVVVANKCDKLKKVRSSQISSVYGMCWGWTTIFRCFCIPARQRSAAESCSDSSKIIFSVVFAVVIRRSFW